MKLKNVQVGKVYQVEDTLVFGRVIEIIPPNYPEDSNHYIKLLHCNYHQYDTSKPIDWDLVKSRWQIMTLQSGHLRECNKEMLDYEETYDPKLIAV